MCMAEVFSLLAGRVVREGAAVDEVESRRGESGMVRVGGEELLGADADKAA